MRICSMTTFENMDVPTVSADEAGLVCEALGTACPDLTNEFCTKTMHATGSCSSNVCTCEDGYDQVNSGCRESGGPTLKIKDLTFGAAAISASGEVENGEDVTLQCSTGSADAAAYKWFAGGTEVAGETDAEYTITTATDGTTTYTCQVNDNGVASSSSNEVTVTVVTGNAMTSKPIVSGNPSAVITGDTHTLTCDNLPITDATLTYTWQRTPSGGTEANVAGETDVTLDVAVSDADNLGAEFTCTVGAGSYSSGNDKSDAVTFPTLWTTAAVTVTIVEGSITVGEGLGVTLTCLITSPDLSVDDSSVTYSWEIPTGSLFTPTNAKHTAVASIATTEAGTYKCSGQIASNAAVESAAITVTVIENPDSHPEIEIIADVAAPPTNGYHILQCNALDPDPWALTWSWLLDDKIIFNHKDRYLQYQPSQGGVFKCSATKTGYTSSLATVTGKTVTVDADITDVTPSVSSNVGSANYGRGESYTFTCKKDDLLSPGFTYSWKKNGATDSSSTTSTFTTTIGSDDSSTTVIACTMSFDGQTSAEGDLTIAAADHKNIMSVAIYQEVLADEAIAPFALSPLSGAVTFKCVVQTAKDAASSATISWENGGVAISGETSTTYVHTGAGTINCAATVGTEVVESATVALTVGGAFGAVSIETTNGPSISTYSAGYEYIFYCKTLSYNDDCTYTWTYDGSTVGSSYILKKTFSESSSKNLICTATCGSSTGSDTLAITIGAEGKPCYFMADCSGAAYTGKCENERCVCQDNYSLSGITCTGAKDAIASLLLALTGLVLSYAFK